MDTKEKLARRYCRRVRGRLPVGGPKKREFLETLHQRVLEFLHESERADAAAVEARFGSPDAIALSFLEQMSYAELTCKIRFRNRVIAAVLAVAFAAVMGLALTFHQMIEYNKNRHDGYIETDIAYTNSALPVSQLEEGEMES